MTIIWNMTGGRPMFRDGLAFVDKVSGKSVHYWTDRIGRQWLAEGAWSLFRVPRAAPSVSGTGEKS